mmetsp:Transcript_25801/g.40798  ORF Transcript_25801/g.40798 Transcript_25801/m.40798 type:complete len:128 (-) Transcript_25801:18-401(-)
MCINVNIQLKVGFGDDVPPNLGCNGGRIVVPACSQVLAHEPSGGQYQALVEADVGCGANHTPDAELLALAPESRCQAMIATGFGFAPTARCAAIHTPDVVLATLVRSAAIRTERMPVMRLQASVVAV